VIYGGNTTCLEVTLSSGATVIIDAGTGMRKLGDALSQRGDSLELYLLMTHIHWDHLMGFPFFAPLFRNNCRIIIDGFSKGLEGLKNVFGPRHVDGTWPISFDDLKAKIEQRHDLTRGTLQIGDTTVEAHHLQHPQGGMGFKFIEGSTTFVFLTDNELREDGWKDTCFRDFVGFCRRADLLIHDCQYFPEELAQRHGWGHSDSDTVARLAARSEVGRLVLFHHDPWRTDVAVEGMVARCQERIEQLGAGVHVDAAKEGCSLEV
jgi:phosphoribosyl 1,2-cyclic phosphodiesterase